MSIIVSRQSAGVVSDISSEHDSANTSNIKASNDGASNNQNSTSGQAKGLMNQAVKNQQDLDMRSTTLFHEEKNAKRPRCASIPDGTLMKIVVKETEMSGLTTSSK
jgi:hypothetical protein